MKSLSKNYFNPFFSHIYIEERVLGHPRTKEILAKFPSARRIIIGHYKDVFCRSRQSYPLQHRAQKLILAAKEGTLLYPGSPVCQNFGNSHFYYASCVMNCIYSCEYCYLKGMYPSANLVVFVNLEDIFAEVEQALQSHPLYLCISYDTDLLALEPIAGYAGEWVRFAKKYRKKQEEQPGAKQEEQLREVQKEQPGTKQEEQLREEQKEQPGTKQEEQLREVQKEQPGAKQEDGLKRNQGDRLKIEIRTKHADMQFFRNTEPLPNVIYAFTLSPQAITEAYERHTPSLRQRIDCAAGAVRKGFPVRLCFDPMIYVKGWQRYYGEMLDVVFGSIDMEKLVDVSVGTFRIAADYLKQMRKQEPGCAAAWFPYQKENGFYHYPDAFMGQMEQFLVGRLKEKLPEGKIFLWRI